MTVQTAHLDALAAYIAEHGEQRQAAICDGMRRVYPDVDMTRYLFKKLRKEGRIEKVGHDSYRVTPDNPVTVGSGNVFADIDLPNPEEPLAEARAKNADTSVVVGHLDTPEAIAEYVIAAFEDGSPELISVVIGDVASAMAILLVKIAHEAPRVVISKAEGRE